MHSKKSLYNISNIYEKNVNFFIYLKTFSYTNRNSRFYHIYLICCTAIFFSVYIYERENKTYTQKIYINLYDSISV